jgi:hypothetical protein
MNLERLPAFDPAMGAVHVIIDTPKGFCVVIPNEVGDPTHSGDGMQTILRDQTAGPSLSLRMTRVRHCGGC